MANSVTVELDPDLNCKDKNVIYIVQCEVEDSCEEVYVGKTEQELSTRISQHEAGFKPEAKNVTALAKHVEEKHPDANPTFQEAFKVGIVMKTEKGNLKKSEQQLINTFDSVDNGINRINACADRKCES